MTLGVLRGFRDYPPPDAGARSAIFGRMRSAARRAGFVELETPSVESLELFQVKSGEEIAKELWAFTDKGGRSVTLVAETTPSLARAYVELAKALPQPVKWFTLSKLWRYEEPQAGRTREFTQFNLDILGAAGVEAEVDLLLAAAGILDEAGAEGLYEFRLNDRQLVEGMGRSLGATDLPRFFRALDRSHKDTPAEFASALAEAGLSEDRVEQLLGDLASIENGVPVTEAPGILDGWLARGLADPGPEGARRLRRLFDLLAATRLRDRVHLDLRIVRGFAYYTSTVFEAFGRSGERRSIFGGGRYDRLIELFGGPATPAVGLAIGDQTLELLLRANGRWPDGEPPIDTYVIAVTPEQVPEAIEVVDALRASGVSADFDLMDRTLGRQLREAGRRKARRAILVGPQELERGMLLERDLTTGAQREFPRASVGAPGGPGAKAGATPLPGPG
ncbi:MAG: histidine--tRNA ligase [Thermoplasmata archaeon]|nr:histidine--tRNA ligase [Thermoplasmata archaeon]MCI4359038.1 histidine--tRNA ligase [Thermoplasmata archaeon]